MAGYYVASSASIPERSAMWRMYRERGVPIISTWIDEAGPGETSSHSDLWTRIEAEVRASDGLVLYLETGDLPVKGALVEVGMALMAGKHVVVVAPGVSRAMVGLWASHPLVLRMFTVDDAFAALKVPPKWPASGSEGCHDPDCEDCFGR